MAVATLRILVLEDTPADALALRVVLEQDLFARHQLTLVERLADGLDKLAQEPFDAILLDLDLLDSQGLESIQRLQGAAADLPIVVISGMMDETVALRAVQAGAQDYVVKDATGWATLARVVRYAVERHNLVQVIEAGEGRFATIFQRSPAGQIITTLKDGRIVDVNAAFCHMMGYKREDVLGQTTLEIDIWADLEERSAAFDAFGEAGRVENRTVVFRTSSGEARTVLASVEPIEIDGERCVISTALDITERKQADDAIRNRERQLQALVSSLDDIVFEVDEWGTYRNVWTANDSILFRPRIEIIGKRFDEVFGEEASRGFYEYLQRTLESNTAQTLEYPITIAGVQHWYAARYSPILGEKKTPRSVSILVRDITERKQAEEKLQRSEADLAEAQRVAKLGNWHFDIASGFVTWSDELYRIFEVEPDAFGGLYESFMRKVHPEDRDHVLAVNAYARESGEPFEVEYRIVTPNKNEKLVREVGFTLKNDDGQVTGMFGIAQDITERKQAELLIAAQRDLSRSIATFPSVKTGFQAILDAVLGLTGLDSGGVYLFDAAFEKLELVYHRGLGEEFVEAVSDFPMDSRNVQLILSGEPSYSAFDDPALHMPLYEDEGLRSFAVVPVLKQDRVIGCLNLASHTKEMIPTFSRQVLETLAVEIGNVVNHVRSQAALHASEAKYRGLVEATDAIVVLLDANGRIQYLNDKAAEISGIEIAEALGRTLHELLPEAIADLNLNRIQEVFASGKGMVVESPIANGRTLRTSVQPVDDETGVTVMVMISATDITDLKNAQQALQELNRSLEERVAQRTAEIQDLYDNAPIGYHSLDAAGRFIQVNQTELNWLGYTRDELIGRPLSDISTQESITIFRQTFPTLIETGSARDIEFEFIRKDGSILPGLVNATVVYDDDGAFLRSRSTIFDNTKRKAAEQALRESEEHTRLLFENTPDAVVLFDAQGRIVRANQAFELLAGLTAEQWIGNSMTTLGLLPDEEVDALAAAVVKAMTDESRPASAEFSISRADGATRSVGARIFGVTIQGRQHYLASLRDITIEKQAAETLRFANLELERALRMKDEFLANMSHELRTPLTGILGLSELLLMQVHGPLTERQQKSIRGVEESGRHLLSLINDLLDLSKIEAGKLELEFEMVSVDDICRASLQFVREMAMKKGIQVDFTDESPDTWLSVDTRRLKQMLINLLSNAVKFTPEEGKVTLRVSTDPSGNLIHFAVQDTGPGIAPADQGKLFEPFVQLDSHLARQHEGTGLGLTLVKRLAEQHGGTVRLESAGIAGEGSCFTITMPYDPTAHPTAVTGTALSTAAPVSAIPGSGPLLLLVEDNEINVEALKDFLEHAGYRIAVARTGAAALDLADAVAPDLILMDVQLPEMDGLEVTRRLRAKARFAQTPIIALTASAMIGDREQCLAAGATDYLSKPLRMRELLGMIEQLTNADRS